MADKVYVSPLHVVILQVPLRNLQSISYQAKNKWEQMQILFE